MRTILVHLAVVTCCWAGICSPLAAGDPPYQAKSSPAGKLTLERGIPVLEVWGSPESMGEGIGSLALSQAKGILEYPRLLARQYRAEFLFPVLLTLGNGMIQGIPAPYMAELKSMHKHSQAPWETLVAGNTMFDLKKFVLCSGMALAPGTSFSRGSILARNLDYPPVGNISRYSLVSIMHPEGKHSFVSVGFPGLVGVLSGMNDAGLALAILEVIDIKPGLKRFDSQGIPYALCYRTVLEECTTIDEAIARLGKLRRTCLTNLLIADKKEVAVLEISPDFVKKRDPKAGVVCCSNHFCLDSMKPAAPLNPHRSVERLDYLEAKTSSGNIRFEDICANLDGVRLGRQTLQSMIFDTDTLDLWVSFAGPPASAGPFVHIPLKERLIKRKNKTPEVASSPVSNP